MSLEVKIQPATKIGDLLVVGDPKIIQIDPLAVTYIEATTYSDYSDTIQRTDLKISTNDGKLAVETFGNGADVLKKIEGSFADGLAHKFVQVTRVQETSGGSTNHPNPEIISVPNFLKRVAG